MRSLFDVNSLIALLDSNHDDHPRVRSWLEAEVSAGWTTCALTENGFVRIVCQRRYKHPLRPNDAVRRLSRAMTNPYHQRWRCEISLVDSWIDFKHIQGPGQLTDVYLLALAVFHRGRLVTLDQKIPLHAVPEADESQLVVL